MQLIIIILLIVGFLSYGKLALKNHFNSQENKESSQNIKSIKQPDTNSTIKKAQDLRKQQADALKKHNESLQKQRLESYNQTDYFDNQ